MNNNYSSAFVPCKITYFPHNKCSIKVYFSQRRKWQPTPVFLPRESHGHRRLMGYSPWGHKKLDATEQLTHTKVYLILQDYLKILSWWRAWDPHSTRTLHSLGEKSEWKWGQISLPVFLARKFWTPELNPELFFSPWCNILNASFIQVLEGIQKRKNKKSLPSNPCLSLILTISELCNLLICMYVGKISLFWFHVAVNIK